MFSTIIICNCNYVFLMFAIKMSLILESSSTVTILVPSSCYDNATYEIKLTDVKSYKNSSAIIELKSYTKTVSCVFDIEPPDESSGVLITLHKLNFGNLGTGGYFRVSDGSKFQIFNETHTITQAGLIFHPSDVGKIVHIEFYIKFSSSSYSPSGTLIATIFTMGSCTQHKCGNNLCISNTLVCNEYNNCGDGSDENNCGLFGSQAAKNIGYVLLVVFSLLIITSFVTIAYVLLKRKSTRMDLETLYNQGLQPINLEIQTDPESVDAHTISQRLSVSTGNVEPRNVTAGNEKDKHEKASVPEKANIAN